MSSDALEHLVRKYVTYVRTSLPRHTDPVVVDHSLMDRARPYVDLSTVVVDALDGILSTYEPEMQMLIIGRLSLTACDRLSQHVDKLEVGSLEDDWAMLLVSLTMGMLAEEEQAEDVLPEDVEGLQDEDFDDAESNAVEPEDELNPTRHVESDARPSLADVIERGLLDSMRQNAKDVPPKRPTLAEFERNEPEPER